MSADDVPNDDEWWCREGWRWSAADNAYMWWNGSQYTGRCTWDGSSWTWTPIEPAAKPPIVSLVLGWSGVAIGLINALSLFLLSTYLAPLGLGLGVGGLIQARREGIRSPVSVAAIGLSLLGLAGAAFWFLNGFPRAFTTS